MNSNQSYCLGGRPFSQTVNKCFFEKENPKTKILVKIVKGTCSICEGAKSQVFTKYMTRAENFIKIAKCKHGHRSAMSNSAWCGLNKTCTVLKLHDMCHNPKSNCQKQNTFTPKQYKLEGGSIKSKLQKIFKGAQSAWNKILKPAINATAPFLGMALSAKTKNPKVGQATTNILNSISGGRILSLRDLNGNGLRLKVM